MKHFYLGAINKNTNLYEYPSFAVKNNNYSCPECKKDVILKKGKIKIAHFSHKKSDQPCNHYITPDTKTIHNIAQEEIIKLLNKHELNFLQQCSSCDHKNRFLIKLKNNCEVKKEYRTKIDNNIYIYDIAILQNNNVKFVIEIYNTHKTEEIKRPNIIWVELDAKKTLQKINDSNFIFDCIRNGYECKNCMKKAEEKQKLLEEKNNDVGNIEYLERNEIITERDNFIRCMFRLKFDFIQADKKQNDERHKILSEYDKFVNDATKEMNRVKKIIVDLRKKHFTFSIEHNENLNREKMIKHFFDDLEYIEKKYAYEKHKILNNTHCKCNLEFKNICNCDVPNFIIHELTQNMHCKKCKLWKCRCI